MEPALKWTSLLAIVLTACMGQSADGQQANDSEGAASGGSGVSASGGSATASGGASGTVVGSGGPMTDEEWREATAPRPETHDIWTSDLCADLHAGSISTHVGQEYSVIPPLTQTISADFEAETNPVLDISLAPYCITSAECTEQPGGVCQGQLDEAYCQYAVPPPREACREDADCVKKPNGKCEAPLGLSEYTLCYPTGVCESPGGSCSYALHAPCTTNADCSEGEDGQCIFPVTNTACRYGTCFDDADCEDALRCACGQCVEADCASDDACADGETCELSPPWCFEGPSFHCSTPEDECSAGEPGCIYQSSPDRPYWSTGFCLK